MILKKNHQKQAKKLIIFASGNGSNAENIIKHFNNNPDVVVQSVFCNTLKAKVLDKAKAEKVDTFVFNKSELQNREIVLAKLEELSPDLIILAGFLLKIPDFIISSFDQKIINIHPALLPKYGGKGMYGMNVHKAVVHNKEPKTGITIHYVNENYDEGAIIFQAECDVLKTDSPEDVAHKIHKLEMQYFPKVIERTVKGF